MVIRECLEGILPIEAREAIILGKSVREERHQKMPEFGHIAARSCH
jgi:hypothetical protein